MDLDVLLSVETEAVACLFLLIRTSIEILLQFKNFPQQFEQISCETQNWGYTVIQKKNIKQINLLVSLLADLKWYDWLVFWGCCPLNYGWQIMFCYILKHEIKRKLFLTSKSFYFTIKRVNLTARFVVFWLLCYLDFPGLEYFRFQIYLLIL